MRVWRATPSTHAAGVVISREPLVEHLPLARPARGDQQAMPTTQYAMEPVAAIGLVKMDFLGLSNLTILQRVVDLIADRHGVTVDLENLPDGDEKTFSMLSSGETFGVFQLESAGMRRAMTELKPTGVDDLAALVALYRPGPMQHIGTFCVPSTASSKSLIRTMTWPTSWTRPTASSFTRTRSSKSHRSSPATRSALPTSCARRWVRRLPP